VVTITVADGKPQISHVSFTFGTYHCVEEKDAGLRLDVISLDHVIGYVINSMDFSHHVMFKIHLIHTKTSSPAGLPLKRNIT
jgi:hypothetical protein